VVHEQGNISLETRHAVAQFARRYDADRYPLRDRGGIGAIVDAGRRSGRNHGNERR
jgi:hypothetical protein